MIEPEDYAPLPLSSRDPNVLRDMRKYVQSAGASGMVRWYVLSPGVISATQKMPTREEMILGAMSIATHEQIGKDARGHSCLGPVTYWSRERAEHAVDALGIVFPEVVEFAAPF